MHESSLKHGRFSIRTVIALVTFTAWVVTVLLPGGFYVMLPIGVCFILVLSCINAYWNFSPEKLKNNFRLTQLVVSLLLLIAILVVYTPFLSLAANVAKHERDVASMRTYVLNSMRTDTLRDDGRKLLQHMHSESIESVFPSEDCVSEFIRSLKPLHILASEECLQLTIGKGDDSFSLLVYPDGAEGRGTQRLSKGVWLFESGRNSWITDTEWESGARN